MKYSINEFQTPSPYVAKKPNTQKSYLYACMSSAYKILPHYTYEDRLRWEDNWELIEGIPYAMSPSPVPKHQKVAAELRYEFTSALKKSKCSKCRAYDPIDYKINEDTILIPDILRACLKIKCKKRYGHC